MNSALIEELNSLLGIAGQMGQVYRVKAYRRAIAELSKLQFQITKKNLPGLKIVGVGSGIVDKINEFLLTGKIAEIKKIRDSKEYKGYENFNGILGVGPATIKEWASMKIFTRSDLRRAISKGLIQLNHMQKCGLKYYKDLNTRIPHNEITLIADFIKRGLTQIDPDVIFNVAGSYRRNAPTSGDIDILIANPRQFNQTLLPEFMVLLKSDSTFVEPISTGRERVTFLFRSPVSCKVRQIDVLNLPVANYFAGLLYFTGSFEFNILMRAHAKKLGFRLNQNGLYKAVDDKLELIPVQNEAGLFKLLGLKYVLPPDRNTAEIILNPP